MARELNRCGSVMVAVAAFIVCGVAFYGSRRARSHSRGTAAYWMARKRRAMLHDAKLPTAAELNPMAQKHFEQHGSGNKQDWDSHLNMVTRAGSRKPIPTEISKQTPNAEHRSRQCFKISYLIDLFGPQTTRRHGVQKGAFANSLPICAD
jgi:hypothetical protein